MANEPRDGRDRRADDDPDLRRRTAFLEQELELLRAKVAESPRHMRLLEDRLTEAQARVAALTDRNDRLADTLREARDQMVAAQGGDRPARPAAERLRRVPRGVRGRHRRHLHLRPQAARRGLARGRRRRPQARPGGHAQRGDERRRRPRASSAPARSSCSRRSSTAATARWSSATPTRSASSTSPTSCARSRCAPATRCCSSRARPTPTSGCPRARSRSSSSKRSPTSTTPTSAACRSQIEAIRDAVELPFLHADLFREHQLRPPKGILLYGPPGCGKTLIAKAVANSLAKQVQKVHGGDEKATAFFLNIKGPELLNKYVGETERHIRLVFQRAREKASDGTPVIVFFDEMDSIFRTRGSGVSSDVENTIVPQLLSEIDGVEGLENVIVIGASNREDMIDPAILRPGRLDVKIKIERPDAEAAQRHLRQVPDPRAADPRRRPRRARRRRDAPRRGDDPAHRRADVHRDRGEPLPRGHLRQR